MTWCDRATKLESPGAAAVLVSDGFSAPLHEQTETAEIPATTRPNRRMFFIMIARVESGRQERSAVRVYSRKHEVVWFFSSRSTFQPFRSASVGLTAVARRAGSAHARAA